jgi:hypothetical protein
MIIFEQALGNVDVYETVKRFASFASTIKIAGDLS